MLFTRRRLWRRKRIGRVWNREDLAGSLIAGPRGMLKMRGERKKIGHAFDAARRV